MEARLRQEGRRVLSLGLRLGVFFLAALATGLTLSLLPWQGLPWQGLPVLGAALVGGWAALALDGRGPGALGFYLHPSLGGESLAGFGLGAGAAVLVLGGIALLGGLGWRWEGGSLGSWVSMGLATLWVLSLPAAAEEALTRGYLLQGISHYYGVPAGLIVMSAVFGLLHGWNPGVAPGALANLVLAGVFLGVVYLKTASLWWASGAHLGWNWTLAFLGDVPLSGLDLVDTPHLEAEFRGPTWLTGGDFGPEASLVATAVLAGLALGLWRTRRLRPGAAARERRPLFLAEEPPVAPPSRGRPGRRGNSEERLP